MGWIQAHKGNLDSAYIYARRATNMWTLKTHPSRGVAPLRTLIDIHIIAGKYDSALQVIEKLLSVPAEFDLGTFFLDPDYRQLIHEPGFADLVRKYGNEYHKKLYQEKVGPL